MAQLKTKMIIVAAPSGAGKSSFVERICAEEPRLRDTVTFTTREMRAGESPGKPYHFVSTTEFEVLLAKNFFVEWARVHDNLYGTPLEQLEQAWSENQCIIMDVDVQGAETFRRKYPESKSIFILPPSIDELRRRVIKRDGKVPADLEVRMTNAEKEIQFADKFDFQIVNDDFHTSYAKFKKIVEELLT
ncbi:MAG: guanylate kinase [Bdellovibrio sp. CG10_big_fil_rev_8_21_14_0_10_47_8]|nr:MAG: guanylate kinase [Bdellovibrio sp. CG10_big_fil_rev_8_21_14_0_10_47_8]